MRYPDGKPVLPGDRVLIDEWEAVVRVSIDDRQGSEGFLLADWEFLGEGVVVETKEAGLVHYRSAQPEKL